MPETEYRIAHYDLKTGWSSIPEPSWAGNDSQIKAAGFSMFVQAGVAGAQGVQVYSGPDNQYLFMVDGLNSTVATIIAADLPSMIELFHKLGPLGIAAQFQEFQDAIYDLQNLLTGEAGPLAEAKAARARRTRA